jgi:hypothetical protein
MRSMHQTTVTALILLGGLLAPPASSYPLDGYDYTGLARLEHQRRVQLGELPGRKRPAGELLPLEQVQLRLLDQPDLVLPAPDPKLTASVKHLLGEHANRYGISLLDLSDPAAPRYAAWQENQRQNPGSVGKLLVALGVFQGLADAWPDSIADRERVLRDARITADIFSVYDHHTVRFFDVETGTLTRHPIQKGDTGSLWTYLDWMMSPSSNSAAGMLQKNLILLAHYGKAYPVSAEEKARFFKETKKTELAAIFEKAIQEPITRNGLDLDTLRQGSFFTHEGKKRVPGTSSYATPRSLLDYMVKMEQGKLVDAWSSREIKRLMYITERRIRYGSSGALRESAVYFKSGSLYSCEPEEGFVCRKYHGNKRNYMNSTAIIESPAGQDRLYYMVTVLSNVLRKNSAQDHRDLARAIQARLLRDHPPKPLAEGQLPPSATFGEGFVGYQSERAEVLLKVETQEALLALGYEIGEMDGVIGARTKGAIRDFERSQGIPATGTPSRSLIDRMRAVAQERGAWRPEPGAPSPPAP